MRWGVAASSQDSMEAFAEKISKASWLYTTPEKSVHNVSTQWGALLRSEGHRVTLVVYDEAHEWREDWRDGICDCTHRLS